MAKLVTTLVFVVSVVSLDRYALGSLIPYVFYPVLMIALSDTPCAPLVKRALIALPFCLFAALSNVFFDRGAALILGGMVISHGMISFCVVLLRACLCVMAVLTLAAVTPFAQLTAQLRRLRVPTIMVTVFEMTYRYVGVLLEEAASMVTAYRLRAGRQTRVDMRHMGSLLSQLLLRSFDRAERVYAAMQCRGYALAGVRQRNLPLTARDALYIALVSAMCLLFRFVDMSALASRLMGGI